MEIKKGTIWIRSTTGEGDWIVVGVINDFVYYSRWNRNGINFNSTRCLNKKRFELNYHPYRGPLIYLSYAGINDTKVSKIEPWKLVKMTMAAMSKFEFLDKLSVDGVEI